MPLFIIADMQAVKCFQFETLVKEVKKSLILLL